MHVIYVYFRLSVELLVNLYITTPYCLKCLVVDFYVYHSLCFQNMVYYKISHVDGRITNPEQRIASDVPRFCSELSEIVQDDLTAVTDGVLYTWRLCSYASPKYVFWILVTF